MQLSDDSVKFCCTILNIMNTILRDGEIPCAWRKTLFQMLPKTKQSKVTTDFRPIANICLMYKIFAYLILGRIEAPLEQWQPEEQHGFRINRRMEEHLLTANMVIDKTLLANTALWIVSLDLSKAFDRGILPKTGDLTNPGNWRPLAILNITYKIFTRMVYKRVKPILEAQQSKDQIGFRSFVGVDDAFAVFENVCSKSMEWSVPIWFASLDLRKAFDRIEYNALFDALKMQGVPHAYLKLIASLYHDQVGLVQGKQFQIKRGVKQGDVLSPLLFNAGLEHAMRKWKLRVQHCGLYCGGDELLTNVRYADDLMLYARSYSDLATMVECLVEELAAVGLNLNTSKTKILTTENLNEPMFLDIGGDMIEVLHGGQNHKYLGKKLSGDLRKRAMVDIQHRSQIAWMKFNEHRNTLLNRHVSLRLRLKLFDSVITPTILFGLLTCPLTSNQLQKLELVRNRMLRSIVGWVPLVDNDWHALMQTMNRKLENAQQIFNVRPWTERLLVGRFRFAAKIASAMNS